MTLAERLCVRCGDEIVAEEALLQAIFDEPRLCPRCQWRDEALEEAAKVAEDLGNELDGPTLADRIRALKSGRSCGHKCVALHGYCPECNPKVDV